MEGEVVDHGEIKAVVSLCQIDQQCAFLAAYAMYMEGERAKHADGGGGGAVAPAVAAATAATAAGPTTAVVLEMLTSSLETFPTDSYLWWLYGITTIRQSKAAADTTTASSSKTNNGATAEVNDTEFFSNDGGGAGSCGGVQALITAIRYQPLFWSAYHDLRNELSSPAHLQETYNVIVAHTATTTTSAEPGNNNNNTFASNPPLVHASLILPQLFLSSAHSSLHTPVTMEASLAMLNNLQENAIPGNPFLLQQLGEMQYSLENLHDAIVPFSELRNSHPFALEGLDTYSHVLFLLGDRLTLSVLAQEAYNINPVSAYSNVVVGNYFSATRRRDQALFHFRRATVINPTLTTAWTLLGHENISLKKTNAAADAYRAALIVNPRDYRAWHALGNIYITHHMQSFALHYFQRAVENRPFDPRLWHALSECFNKLERHGERTQCLEQAELLEPPNSLRACTTARALVGMYTAYGGAMNGSGNGIQKALHFMQKVVASSHSLPKDLEIMLPRLVRHYCSLSAEYGEAAAAAASASSSSCYGSPSSPNIGGASSSEATLKATQQHCAVQAAHYLQRLQEHLISVGGEEGVEVGGGGGGAQQEGYSRGAASAVSSSSTAAVSSSSSFPVHEGGGGGRGETPSVDPSHQQHQPWISSSNSYRNNNNNTTNSTEGTRHGSGIIVNEEASLLNRQLSELVSSVMQSLR